MNGRQTQNGQNGQDPQDQHSPLQIRLYVASAAILIVGLIAAAIIYVTAPAGDSAELIYGVTNNQQYLLELQRIGGTAEVAMAAFHQWFDSLWHGKPLAYTVAFVCVSCLPAPAFWRHVAGSSNRHMKKPTIRTNPAGSRYITRWLPIRSTSPSPLITHA